MNTLPEWRRSYVTRLTACSRRRVRATCTVTQPPVGPFAGLPLTDGRPGESDFPSGGPFDIVVPGHNAASVKRFHNSRLPSRSRRVSIPTPPRSGQASVQPRAPAFVPRSPASVRADWPSESISASPSSRVQGSKFPGGYRRHSYCAQMTTDQCRPCSGLAWNSPSVRQAEAMA